MWNPDPKIKYDVYDPPIKLPHELTEAEKRDLAEGHEERMRIILNAAKNDTRTIHGGADNGKGRI